MWQFFSSWGFDAKREKEKEKKRREKRGKRGEIREEVTALYIILSINRIHIPQHHLNSFLKTISERSSRTSPTPHGSSFSRVDASSVAMRTRPSLSLYSSSPPFSLLRSLGFYHLSFAATLCLSPTLRPLPLRLILVLDYSGCPAALGRGNHAAGRASPGGRRAPAGPTRDEAGPAPGAPRRDARAPPVGHHHLTRSPGAANRRRGRAGGPHHVGMLAACVSPPGRGASVGP